MNKELTCLTCTLPSNACETDPQCPFTRPKAPITIGKGQGSYRTRAARESTAAERSRMSTRYDGRKPTRRAQPEFELQKAVCQYISVKHPNVLFLSDVKAAVKLTVIQGARLTKVQKDGFKCPDLMIFAPRGDYHGLFIELKAESPYRKDGITLKANDHVQAQANSIADLREKGYAADFAWTFDGAVKMIDEYLGL